MRKRKRAKRSSRRQRGVNVGASRPVVSVNVRVHEVPSSTGSGGPGMAMGATGRSDVELGAFVPPNIAKAVREGRRRNARVSPAPLRGGGGPVPAPALTSARGGPPPVRSGAGRRPGRPGRPGRRRRYWRWWYDYGPSYPYVYQPIYFYYPWGYQNVEGLPLPEECGSPLSSDCQRLTLTKRWAIVCFMPLYNRMRAHFGDEPAEVVTAMMQAVSPNCLAQMTDATRELRRRFALATVILMRGEGYPISMVSVPQATPQDRQEYKQPWMRALMTGTL